MVLPRASLTERGLPEMSSWRRVSMGVVAEELDGLEGAAESVEHGADGGRSWTNGTRVVVKIPGTGVWTGPLSRRVGCSGR
jgi:hypothetical protein